MPTPGTLRSALHSQAFRRLFAGTLASNVGTWMQNITLISLAYALTGDAWFTGVITFAQLGPMLVLSPFGGAIADRFNRRRIIVALSGWQMALSLVLAIVALSDDPNRLVLVLVVAGIGCANAINGPTMNALLPTLVPRTDMQPAIALNSVAMNSSRVVGPLLGGLVGSLAGSSAVFLVNGTTYLFVIWAVMSVDVDFSPKGSHSDGPLRQLQIGLRAARGRHADHPGAHHHLGAVAVLARLHLPDALARRAAPGPHRMALQPALRIVRTRRRRRGAVDGVVPVVAGPGGHHRGALVVFAGSLAVFGTTSIVAVAFGTAFVLGAAYFVIVTALSTTLQMRVADEVRGRVMGLWMMAWAGLVPLGGLLAGPVIDSVGISAVLLFGAAVALLLAVVIDLRDPELVALGAE